MLKRMVAALTACVLLLGVALAEGSPDAFAGLWADPAIGRAELSVMPVDPRDAGEDSRQYDIWLTWGSSAFERGVWTMTARLEDGALVYTGGRHTDVTLMEDGGVESEALLWEDAEGRFTLSEDGRLLWTDSREETAADFRFERHQSFAPTAEELRENVVDPVADLGTGTAGASLKLALTACDVARFASENLLWNADSDALKENLLAALDGDARSRFDENWPETAELLDAAFENYDDVAGQFDDAGAGDAMAAMAADPGARQSWRMLEALLLSGEN